MKATDWEFKNRAMIFGIIIGGSFFLYTLDAENATALVANRLEGKFHLTADTIAHGLFLCAAACCVLAAMLRTWASSYLDSNVVYAAKIQSVLLVADGPYRFVRNPLYLANLLLVLALGTMMSRSGYAAAVLLMLVYCCRLIFREESELRVAQGDPYKRYCEVVPRLRPSMRPHVAKSGRKPNWSAGLKVELCIWGFAGALLAFAFTFSVPLFFSVMIFGLVLFWLCTRT